MRHLRRKVVLLASAAVAATTIVGVTAPAGSAALLCGGSAGSPVFLRWLDPAAYTLAPGGSFEAKTPSWSASGGAKVVSGNESYYLSSSRDSRSLKLPSGASATSPASCVSTTQVDLRLLARGGGTLQVDVLGKGLLGLTVLQSQRFTVGASWSPSPLLVFTNGLQTLATGSTANVYFRVTALAGTIQVDDVYVDPFLCK